MENKTPGLTKLILIVESALLAVTLVSFYFLKEVMKFPEGVFWLWMALAAFSAASFLFFFIVLIISLVKRSLRATYWTPLFFTFTIVFIVLAVLIVIGPGIMQPQIIEIPVSETIAEAEIVEETESSQAEEKTNSQQVEAETSSEPEEIKVYNIGDLVEIGNTTVMVNGVRTLEKDEWDEQTEEGYIYLLVDVSIENKGNNDVYIDTYMNFRLVDKDGRNYKPVYAEKARGHVDGPLSPGRKIAGELGYGIPQGVNEFELEIKDPDQQMMASGGEIVLISIVLE